MLACHKQVVACRCLVCLSPFNLSDFAKESIQKSRILKHRAIADAVSAARERLRQFSLISAEIPCPKLHPCAWYGIPELYKQRVWELCSLCPQLCGPIWVSKSMPGTSLASCLSLAICRGLSPLFSHLGYYLKAIMLESTPSHLGGHGGGGWSSDPCRAHSQGLDLHTYYLPAHAQSETP